MKKKLAAKTLDNNTENLNVAKNHTYDPEFVSWDNLATRLKEWSKRPDSLMLEEFYLNLDIPRKTFYENVNSNEKLKAAHEFALEMIGVNREKIAIKTNATINHIIAYPLGHYLERYDTEQTKKANLRKTDDDRDEKLKVIYIEKTESTGLVPKRKAQDDTVANEIL
jgi:hypothetical protein